MENWYKPGPVRISHVEPDSRPRKPKRKTAYNDVLDYQAKNMEKIRKRLQHAKRK